MTRSSDKLAPRGPLGQGHIRDRGRAVSASFRSVPSNASEALLRLRSRALALGHLNYASGAALTACLFGFGALLAGTHLVGPARTVVQQERVQSPEMASTAQMMADAPHAQTAVVADLQTPQTPHAQDVDGSAITKPRPVADKPKSALRPPALRARPSARDPNPRRNSPKRASGSIIELTIAALIAAAPAADRSGSQRRPSGSRRNAGAAARSIRPGIRPPPALPVRLEQSRGPRAQRRKTNLDREPISREPPARVTPFRSTQLGWQAVAQSP